jgi:nucleoside-diphosphate-sugar epimerase
MNILLTGATGFIGSYLLKALIKKHHNVTIIKRKVSNMRRVQEVLDKVQVYDIDKINIEKIFDENKFDAVIHCAATYIRDTETFFKSFSANVFFPMQILENAARTKVKKFINTQTSLPLIKGSPTYNYVFSKKVFADSAVAYSDNIDFINITLGYVFGPYEDKIKVLPFVIDSCIKNVDEINLTSCKQKRDFIYIDDVIEAYLKILKIKKGQGNNFEAGLGKAVALKEVVINIKKVTHSKTKLNFGALLQRLGEPKEIKSNNKTLLALGWKPKFSIERGIKNIIKREYKK